MYQSGKCLGFDGTHKVATLNPINFGADYAEGFTISFWFKATSADAESQYPRIFDFGVLKEDNNILFGGLAQTNNLYFEVYRKVAGVSQYKQLVAGTNQFTKNVWMHIAISVEKIPVVGAPGFANVRIYKNGVQIASDTSGTFFYPDNVLLTKAYIGRTVWADEIPSIEEDEIGFKGYIDSFVIYPTYATADEVQIMYETTTNVVSAKHGHATCKHGS